MSVVYGSVCSGIEAASAAWEPLGWKAAWLSEIEPAPRAVLAHHHPDVPLHGDFTLLRNDAEAVAGIDVLVGGTPCQAFSVAGLRQSLADDRGNLTLEFVRLADAIDDVRGKRGQRGLTIVWENVPGVLSTKDNAFGCFLAALVGADAPLVPPRGGRWTNAGMVAGPRRRAAWIVKDAQYFGLAQRRERVFLVANPGNGADPSAVLFEPEGVRRHSPPRREAGAGVTQALTRSLGAGGADDNRAQGGFYVPTSAQEIQPDGHGLDMGTRHAQSAPLAFGGNNTGAIDVATAINAHGGPCGRMDFESETFVCHGTQDPDVLRNLAHPLGRNQGQENAICVTGHTTHALTPEGFDASEDGTERGSQIVAFRACGQDGFTPSDVAPPLAATDGGGAGAPTAHTTTGVRRLTPRECERLQGFSDDYTLVPFGRGVSQSKIDADWIKYLLRGNPRGLTRDDVARLSADGPRYKALGNSMAVPVMAWIGQRIQQVESLGLAPSRSLPPCEPPPNDLP